MSSSFEKSVKGATKIKVRVQSWRRALDEPNISGNHEPNQFSSMGAVSQDSTWY
jgi:hypothetical protein